jgi:hypothetical protein
VEIIDINMDLSISSRISKEWGISSDTIQRYESFFCETIRPIIKTNYLSHLVTTVESMVNKRRMAKLLEVVTEVDKIHFRSVLASKTYRLYSIILVPINLKRRATTRYHPSGAIIYYNSCYEEKIIRILIAHEVGHIVNKELLENAEDSEKTANLFAYIAMDDKNQFYTEESKKFISKSSIQILDDILNICPT